MDNLGEGVEFETMKGETIVRVTGLVAGSELVELHCESGRTYSLFHNQDCCENVAVEDVVGNIDDLIGVPLLMADATETHPEDDDESSTCTFYKLATVKGYMDIRWLGTSNGWYSETVGVYMRETKIP